MKEPLLRGCRFVDLEVKGDDRGSLIAFEENGNVPYAIGKISCIFGTRSDSYRESLPGLGSMRIVVAVSGVCVLGVNDGNSRSDIILDRPDRAILIPLDLDGEVRDISPDCVLLLIGEPSCSE